MRIPVAAAMLAVCLAAGAWLTVTKAQDEQQATAGSVSAELRELYEADQQDRRSGVGTSPGAWKEIVARDRVRRNRVIELTRGGQLQTAEDYYHAAMVQRLGTQFVRQPPSEPRSQGAYETWLPDSIRAEFGVRLLEEQRKQVEKLNGASGGK